jgi:hypothetical protein
MVFWNGEVLLIIVMMPGQAFFLVRWVFKIRKAQKAI